MNFSSVSKEAKLEIYNKKISSIEEDLFIKVLEIGIDPDLFDIDEFIDSFESMDESVDNYSNFMLLNKSVISYLDIKNKINLLEKE
jgi:hypothetical protein